MGKGGYELWANDSAANWFGSTFDLTGLAEHSKQTLNLRIDEHADEVRAAAYVVSLRAEPYMWPITSRMRCVRLAIARLHEIAAYLLQSFGGVAKVLADQFASRHRSRRQAVNQGEFIALCAAAVM